MTERGARHVERSADRFVIGPSSLRWEGDDLVIDIAERAAPLPQRVAGRIRVRPEVLPATIFTLEAPGGHVWQPVAPLARVEVAMQEPALRWSGDGYLDSNAGAEPLEAGFSSWHWSRSRSGRGARVLYDAVPRRGRPFAASLEFDASGAVADVPLPPPASLPRSFWRIGRDTRADPGTQPTVASVLEDTPFYARSCIRSGLDGEETLSVHESLDLDRFASPWVRLLLPFRMPRTG